MSANLTAPLDEAVAALRDGAAAWARSSIATKRALLAQTHAEIAASAGEWVELARRTKRLPEDSQLVGEEWITGPYALLAYTAALGETLSVLERGGDVLAGLRSRPAPGGRCAIGVLPHSAFDRLLLNGYRADVWLAPGVAREQASATAAAALRHPDGGGVALVLGAGNVWSIGPLDVLSKLFAANRVALLKLNPVNDALRPLLERIFAPFAARGFVRVASGDASAGAYLAAHPGIDEIHLTGSAATHDAIVFGPGEEGARRRAAGEPLLAKPVTSELGGVSPTIVLPGRWSRADLRHQAAHVATQRLHNNGANCVATQMLVLPAGWPQREAFLDCLRAALRDAPGRAPHYPGTAERQASAIATHPGAETLGGDPPRTLLCGLDAGSPDAAFSSEYFGPVLGVVELAAEGAADYLDRAVAFANERLTGTLGAGLIGHPRTLRELGPRLWQAVAELRYGAIGVNCWTAVAYLTPRASWGAFPGHTPQDVQSGIGVVHNALLLERPERTVAQGPFRPAPRSLLHGEPALSPKPPWFVTNRTAATTGRRLSSFAAAPRWAALPGIFASALRG